jgi:hypothetical protein
LGGRYRLADGDQGQLHPGFSESHPVAGVNANSLLYALAVDEGAKGAVIEED